MKSLKLFMLLLGCKPQGRNTEQHDVFLGIGAELNDLLPGIFEFWPEAKKRIHIDAWREVNKVGEYDIRIISRENKLPTKETAGLFFLNLGGYKQGEFEEYHYKILIAALGKAEAVQMSKETTFYIHTGFKGATSHIDDKYGVDVDDVYEIADILPESVKGKYCIAVSPSKGGNEDELHLGYIRLDKLQSQLSG
jgi:hypothetical protein